MNCKKCSYAPKTYNEYCIAQTNPSVYCPNAYTEKSHLCENNIKEEEINNNENFRKW